MKVKVETALFQTPFGSKLYGTDGPTSDLDFKVVCLPDIDTLLLNTQVTNRKVIPEGKKDGEKMAAGEAEYEYIPLQVFLDDFYKGQTYALEMAFAVLQDKYTAEEGEKSNLKQWMTWLVERYLTRNVQKMVGYAVSQSRNYGLKTERYNSLCKVLEAFTAYCLGMKSGFDQRGTKMPELNKIVLKDHPNFIQGLLSLAHVKECEILNGAGGTEMAPAVDICGKQFPLTANFAAIIKSVEGSIAQYGDRVKKYDGEGVDWKALSHAIRITEQVVELCESQKFIFPRPNATYLKAVKEGKVELNEALKYLQDSFNKVDVAIMNSTLPDRTPELDEQFKAYKIKVLHSYYD